LFKRLPPIAVNADGTVNSAAYKLDKKPNPEPSLDLGRKTNGPYDALARAPKPGYGIGSITVKDIRDCGCDVEYRPEGGNDAHCVILGNKDRATARALAEKTKVIIDPVKVS